MSILLELSAWVQRCWTWMMGGYFSIDTSRNHRIGYIIRYIPMISQLLEYHHFLENTTIFWRILPFFGEYLHFLERPIISFSLNRPFEEYHHFLERPTVRYFPSVRRLPIRSPWHRQMASPSRPKWQGRQVAGKWQVDHHLIRPKPWVETGYRGWWW